MLLPVSRVSRTTLLALGTMLFVYFTYFTFFQETEFPWRVKAPGQRHGDKIPSTDMVKPSTDMVMPSTDMVMPSTDMVKPSTDEVKPSTDMVKPSTDMVKPSTDEVKPSTDIVKPSSDEVKPSTDEVKPSPLSSPVAAVSAKPPYPTDYLEQKESYEFCENFFTSRYLDYTASHHLPYCESDSRSSFECFRTHTSNPLCIAKGVLIDHTRVDPQKDTAMDCKLRNFTNERLERPWTMKELEGVEDVADMGSYFFGTGVMEQLKRWDLSFMENETETKILCDVRRNNHAWTLMVKREGNMNIWHKLMELWQSMITLDILQIAIDPSTQKPYLSPNDIPKIQVVFEDDQEQTVDEWWPMLTGKAPIRKSKMTTTCLGNVILPLAGSSSPFWQSHMMDQNCHETFLLDAFLRRLYKYIGITPRKDSEKKPIAVTIIDRTGEVRKIFGLAEHVRLAQKRWPEATIQAVDFATLNLREQVELAQNTDVLVGVTGAAMTHILWLPDGSSVAEIMTPEFHYSGFRNLAKMRDLHYVTTHGVNIAADGQTHDDWVAQSMKPSEKRNWQSEPWLYLTSDGFQALIDAAINAALNRGNLTGDVTARPLS